MGSSKAKKTVDQSSGNDEGRGDPLDLFNNYEPPPASFKENTASVEKTHPKPAIVDHESHPPSLGNNNTVVPEMPHPKPTMDSTLHPPSLETNNTGVFENLGPKPAIDSNTIGSLENNIDPKPAMMGFLFGFSCFFLILAVIIALREAKKRRMIRQYLGDNADGFVARKSIMGGWHGVYKKNHHHPRGGSDSASSTQSDSDGCSFGSGPNNNNNNNNNNNYNYNQNCNTIVFSGLGLGPGFSGSSPSSSPEERMEMELDEITLMFDAGKRAEMKLADRNIYLVDDDSYGSIDMDSDLDDDCGDDDLFASVRYGGSESMNDDGESSIPGDEFL